jgi:hypothetical protein
MIMTADTERALLARAEDLADTDDLAETVTGILGRARGNRLDPDALTAVTGAALALGADSVTVYRAEGKPYDFDTDYAEAIDDAEDEIADQLAAVTEARDEAEDARTAAHDALDEARDDLAEARDMPVDRPCTGCHDDRREAIDEAKEAIVDARERIGYAEAAIAELDDAAEKLERALTCIRRALPDLGEVYEPVYEHVDAGRVMPKDGDFITGEGDLVTGYRQSRQAIGGGQ